MSATDPLLEALEQISADNWASERTHRIAREARAAVPAEPEHDPDKPCPTCGLIADEHSAGAECSRLEADHLEIHDALVAIGLAGAINAESIIERIESLRPAEPEAWEWRAGSEAGWRGLPEAKSIARRDAEFKAAIYPDARLFIERRRAPGPWERVDLRARLCPISGDDCPREGPTHSDGSPFGPCDECPARPQDGGER